MAGSASDGRLAIVSSNPPPVMVAIHRETRRREQAPPCQNCRLPEFSEETALKCALKNVFSFAATRFERLV
jgi:hypothetical protein